ncbi:MAG TPA: HIT domain-containing protein [Candidatus Woesearchaeota archaeon]|nr:HIT domain-containing protein [Candidatus Woesearchaeota archaeon]
MSEQQECIFCKIAGKEVESFTVAETDKWLSFLDINPASTGHTLLIPKKHIPVTPLVPKEDYKELSGMIKGISAGFLKGLKARGSTVFVANGFAAGQKAPHAIIHVIPRYIEDGLQLNLPQEEINQEKLAEIYKSFTTNKE